MGRSPGRTARYQVVPAGAAVTGIGLAQADVDELNRRLSVFDPNIQLGVAGQVNQEGSAVVMLMVMGVALFVALRLLAIGAGWLLTRSRLPVHRRAVS